MTPETRRTGAPEHFLSARLGRSPRVHPGSVPQMTHPFRFGVQYSKPIEGTTGNLQHAIDPTMYYNGNAGFSVDFQVEVSASVAGTGVKCRGSSDGIGSMLPLVTASGDASAYSSR